MTESLSNKRELARWLGEF